MERNYNVRVWEKEYMKSRIDKYISVLFFILSGSLFYLLNSNVSLRNDDFMYSFVFLKEAIADSPAPVDINAPIKGLGDVVISQFNHYFSMNGRLPIQFIIQVFCGLLGKRIFDVCTSFVYIALIFGLTKLLVPKARASRHYVWVTCMLWFVFPVGGFFSSGISFSVNYLWSLMACVYFLLLYKKVWDGSRMSGIRYFIALMFSFFAGWSHESYAIGISGALCLYCLLYYKDVKGQKLGLALAFCLGTAMIVFSPGTLGRFHETGGIFHLSDFVLSRIGVLFMMKRLALLVLCFLLFAGCKLIDIKTFCKENLFLLFVLGMEVLFILFVGFVNERSLYGIDIFSLLLFMRMVGQSHIGGWRYWRYAVIPLFGIFLYVTVNVIGALNVVDKEFRTIMENYLENEDGIAYQEALKFASYYNRYVDRLSPGSWEIQAISYYYGKEMHLFPSAYREYITNLDTYFRPEYEVEQDTGLYKIPGTGIYIARVDSCGERSEYTYRFEYMPVSAKSKYSFKQMWSREIYVNRYDIYTVNVRPIRMKGEDIILIDQGAYKDRELKRVVWEKNRESR